jgi:undecaprenyl diphosphate synthase
VSSSSSAAQDKPRSDQSGNAPGDQPNGTTGPEHVAIIMDGNGRWAAQRGLPRVAGHRAGAEALRRAIGAAVEQGVQALTVYAFSSENWRRDEEEIADLTALMRYYLERELATFEKEGVRLKIIGDFSAFGPELTAKLERAMERTEANRRITLVVALNYGGQAEIAGAARRLGEKVAQGELDPAAINAEMLGAELQTADLPQLDLLIRTSGELRLSNFLLWQAAYAELVFLDVLWPDFDEGILASAIGEYRGRQRRFGGR